MERKLKILVVDGSRVSRKLITEAPLRELIADTVEINAVGTAEAALELLATERYDLIASSLLLPDLYGLDLCRAVRRSGKHRNTPFIVITAEPHRSLMKKGFVAGVSDYYDETRGFKGLLDLIRVFIERNAPLKGRVLYIEDSPDDARFITAHMERHGLEVVHTVSAEHALAILDDSYDLVVVNFCLAGNMSGGDFLHNVRCGLRRGHIDLPILVITAHDDPVIQQDIFRAGANEFVTKPVSEEILVARLRNLFQLQSQARQLRAQARRIKALKTRDWLTGVYNRHYLLQNAGQLLGDDRNYPVWLALVDIDDLQSINDANGMLAGDRVLQGVTAAMKSFFKAPDVVVRAGSKEFMIMLMRRSHERCLKELEELRTRITEMKPGGLLITVSIGVATNLGQSRMRFLDLWSSAENALRRAQERGQNRVVSPSGLRSSDRRLRQVGRGDY